MRFLSVIKIAFRALRRNTLRTILTMLGIIIGVGAVIAMVGIGNGAKAQVESRIAALGQNVLMVYAGDMRRGGVSSGFGGVSTLTVEDAQAIEKEVSGVAAISPEIRTYGQFAVGNQNWNSSLLGEGVDYLQIRSWELTDGEFFTEADVRAAAKVCVIGRTTLEKLFGSEDPVGKTIRTKNVPLKILGVLKARGFSIFGSDQDDTVIVPYTTVMKKLAGVTSLRSINIQAQSAELLPKVQEGVTILLRQRHRIQQGREDDFTVRNQQELSETANATTEVMTALLAAIASVSLLVGGIGIMNIMLVSVTERTREIGIRMAVGARGRDILTQFLIEAVTLSSIGGLLGIGLGIGGAKLLTIVKGWPTLISPDSVVMAFVFSAAVGIFFGFYPARKASHLDPIDALRYE